LSSGEICGREEKKAKETIAFIHFDMRLELLKGMSGHHINAGARNLIFAADDSCWRIIVVSAFR